MGAPMPRYVNPAEFLLDLASSDFTRSADSPQNRILKMHVNWQCSPGALDISQLALSRFSEKDGSGHLIEPNFKNTFITVTIALFHRSFIKSYRDIVAYGIRFAMYIGKSAECIYKQTTNPVRSCTHDGNCMASSGSHSSIDWAVYKRHSRPLLGTLLYGANEL